MSADRARAVAIVVFIAMAVWICACAWGMAQNGRYAPYIDGGVRRVLDTRTGRIYFNSKMENIRPDLAAKGEE